MIGFDEILDRHHGDARTGDRRMQRADGGRAAVVGVSPWYGEERADLTCATTAVEGRAPATRHPVLVGADEPDASAEQVVGERRYEPRGAAGWSTRACRW